MAILIHDCDTTNNFSPDNGTISIDTVDKAPITPNVGCILWQIDTVPYSTWLRLNQPMNLAGANVIHFPYKTSDATKPHSLIVRTDYQNYKSYDITPQLVTGSGVLVTVDLTKPTGSAGTLDLASISTFMVEVDSYHDAMQERIDEIEADVAAPPPGTQYTLTMQAGTGGTTNPTPGSHDYAAESIVTVTAIPNTGYMFAGWILDGVSKGTVNPASVTMDSNHILQATFTATPSGEQQLYQSNFPATLVPFSFAGDASGSATLLSASQDPLGIPSCELVHTTVGGTRASLAIINPTNGAFSFGGTKTGGWLVYSSLRIKTSQMRPDITSWTGIAHIRHPDLYGGGSLWYAQLTIFSGKLRLLYYDNGAMQTQDFTSGLGVPQANVKEDYELYVKVGNGNGVVTLLKNGTQLFNKTNVVNHNIAGIAPSGSIGSLEIGTAWGDANAPVYIYNITVSATAFVPLPTVAVMGQVVDVNGNPIPYVGVRAGADIDPNTPWNIKTFWAETYTDANGNFQWTDDPDKLIPIVRFIKLGYGDPSLAVGSVTMLQNITTPSSGTLNLGKITLQTRAPIQPAALPAARYWELRQITLFPYGKPFTSAAFDTQLKLIKSKQLPFNYIQLRINLRGTDISTMNIDSDEQMSLAAVMTGVDTAHNNGFKALVSINSYTDPIGSLHAGGNTTPDPAYMAKYKALVLQAAQACITHNVEAFLMTFENYTFAGQETAAWIDIINSVRALPGWNTKVGATLNHAGPSGWASFQAAVVTDKAFFNLCDIIQYENWCRLSSVMDPTESTINYMWDNSLPWDDYHAFGPTGLNYIKSQYPNALLFMNNGSSNTDECAIYPWTSGNSKIQNQEAQALVYKATFATFQLAQIDGFNMEHYSFDPNGPQGVNNCFNGMFCEEFIKQGLIAHVGGPSQTLMIEVNDNTMGTTDPVPGTYTATQGSAVSVSAIPSTGNMFDHWELDGVNVGATSPYPVNMNTDHTVLAVFVVKPPPPPGKQHLTISCTTGGTTTPAGGVWEYDEGTTAQVTAKPNTGYTFKQWILDNTPITPVQSTITVVMDADHALVAVFESVPPTPTLWNWPFLTWLRNLIKERIGNPA